MTWHGGSAQTVHESSQGHPPGGHHTTSSAASLARGLRNCHLEARQMNGTARFCRNASGRQRTGDARTGEGRNHIILMTSFHLSFQPAQIQPALDV